MKINKHILVLRSSNSLLSSMSHGPSLLIQEALKTKYSKVEVKIISTIEELEIVTLSNPDLCFLGLKQLPLSTTDTTMVWVSDYLDSININYTGSKSEAIALEFDKEKAKNRVSTFGLNTPKYFIGDNIEGVKNYNLKYPLFIKPNNLGNKMGIDSDSVVHDEISFQRKVCSISKITNTKSLIEEYLPGREFSVAVIQESITRSLKAYPIEAIVSKNDRGDSILGRNDSAIHEQVLQVTDKNIHQAICKLAIDVFTALGARDYGRIDMRLDINGIPSFLEANLVPGLQLTNYYPTANNYYRSMSYDESILEIADIAFSRST